MGAVSNLLDFKDQREFPVLVLVDLHNGHPSIAESDPDHGNYLAALAHCREALDCARRLDLPVAFVRKMRPPQSLLATRACPSWIDDIRPRRTDMLFERGLPSCYASSEFAQIAQRYRGLVLAGLFGETSCLSTLIEGYGRGHALFYLADASVSRAGPGISAADMHKSVTAIATLYSDVCSTQSWVEHISQKIAGCA